MSSPIVSTVQPGSVGTIIAMLVLPQADGKAAATYRRSPSGEVTASTSMGSASQPPSRAIVEAIRRAKHFLPSRALPPYPEPYDQISRVSGKWAMYLWSGLQGHGTSSAPSTSGAPTECTHGTKSPSPRRSSTAPPIRVMVRIPTTT